MRHTNIRSLFGGVVGAGLILAASILAGCADSSTAPDAPGNNQPTVNATVETSDPVPSTEANDVRANIVRNSQDTIVVSIDQVITIILSQYPDGEVLGINLDYDRDSLNYECIVRSGGKVYVIVISPKDGTVKSKEEITDYYYVQVIVIRHIVVKVKEAKDRAKEIVKGDVVECNVENIDDRPTYVIIILTSDNRYVTVYVDCETGKERKLNDDGKCEEDGHKNKKGRGHYRHGNGHGYGHRYHCHCQCEDGGGDTTHVPSGIISADSARTIVNASIDSLTITKTELKVENDSTAFYVIEASRDSNEYEFTLDAFTGATVKVRQTAGDFTNTDYQPQVAGDTLVAMSVARTAAIAQVVGDIQSWTLEYDKTDAKWIYTFEIKEQATGTVKEVEVDAKTGVFIKIK